MILVEKTLEISSAVICSDEMEKTYSHLEMLRGGGNESMYTMIEMKAPWLKR